MEFIREIPNNQTEKEQPALSNIGNNNFNIKKKLNFTTLRQCLFFFIIVLIFIFTISKQIPQYFILGYIPIWKWEVFVFVIICGRLVSSWGIWVLIFFLKQNFFLRKRVLYFVYEIKIAFTNCVWFGMILAIWNLLFEKNMQSDTCMVKTFSYIFKISLSLWMITLIYFINISIIRFLSFSFYTIKYIKKMQEVLFDQFIIEKLSHPLDIERIGNFHKQGIKIDELYKLDENDISPRIMKKLIKIAILDDRLTSSEQRLDLKLTDYKSKAMAEKIVANMTLSESEYIYLSDVQRFMEDDEAHKAFNLFGGIKGRQRITKSDLENWVIHSFKKRRFLSLTLKDAESIATKLHLVVNVLVIAIIFPIGLLFIGITSIHSLIAVISTLAMGAFIFRNTAKMMFESIVFFFVYHAFDVGDLCVVDGVEMSVEELGIFKTSFVRYDNLKIMIPNGELTTKYIINKSQSQDVKEILTFLIPPSTSSETIYRIMERIIGHIKNKDHHWRPDPMVSMKAMNDLLQLKLEVQLTHVTNYQQMDVMAERTSEIFVSIVEILKEFNINV